MDVNDLIKGLKTHINFGTDCDNCPFKDEVNCFTKLVNETTKVLEEKNNG